MAAYARVRGSERRVPGPKRVADIASLADVTRTSQEVGILDQEVAMNGRSQQQLSTEQLRWHSNAPDEGVNGNRVQAEAGPTAFAFGPFRIVPYARLLERDGSPAPVSSRAFDLLCLLVSRAGEVVSKGDLMASAWPDVTVEESCLRFHITMLRRTLGDGQGGERYVVNIPGRGYCFVASVDREALPLKHSHGNRVNPSAPIQGDWRLAAV